ncbi:MAG TPA: hypothetical protein VKB93_23950 [Thermoanaerobaculia bacterium]|nr:hypothetical protein [Thermoanaerobaculia bacterium]
MFPRRALVLLLCVLGGAAVALLLMPRIVRSSRHDSSRLCAILDDLRSRPAPPLVLLGNSAGMLGVDARALGGWNLCSPAQTLGEGLLLQQKLPPTVKVVVQLATALQLSANITVESDHANALVMCGGKPSLADRFYARRHVRAAIEGFARPSGGGWLPEQRFVDLEDARLEMRAHQLRILRDAAALAARERRRYVVVLAPIHPRMKTGVIRCPEGLDCIDLTRLLTAGGFRDPTHPNDAGARKLTKAIRDALTARRLLLEG